MPSEESPPQGLTLGIVSDDGGRSFGPVRYTAAAHTTISLRGSPERRFRGLQAYGVPRVAIDLSSGPYRNRLYIVASDYDQQLDRYVVRVWHTGDSGKSWGTAVASDALSGDIGNPAIAVNRDGIIAVTWNDRRQDPQNHCWHLNAAISVNGGESFLPGRRLSRASTCANEPHNWETFASAFNDTDDQGRPRAHVQSGASIPARWPNGGETQGLIADGTGVFHAGWINGETGVMQLWHTAFRVEPAVSARTRAGTATASRNSPKSIPGVPPGFVDVTADIRFSPTDSRLDFTAHSYTITTAIENRSGGSLRGPLYAVMTEFLARDRAMGLRNLAAANADNGGHAEGAVWKFDVPGAALAPGMRTASRVLRFTFEGGIPEIPDGYLSPGFQVYGSAESDANGLSSNTLSKPAVRRTGEESDDRPSSARARSAMSPRHPDGRTTALFADPRRPGVAIDQEDHASGKGSYLGRHLLTRCFEGPRRVKQ